MKAHRVVRIADALATAGILVALQTSPAAVAAPAVAEPHLTTVFENKHVRVMELFASPGTVLTRYRQEPGVTVSLTKSRLMAASAEGESRTFDYNQGQVIWSGPQADRSREVLAGNAHLFIVEVKSAQSGAIPANPPIPRTDSTVVEPDQHHVILDNEHVRVIDGMASAGSDSAAHTHPPSVAVSMAKSRFKVTINGKTRIFDFEPAMVRWNNHFEHQWKVVSGDARVILVEIKSAHGDTEFRRRY